MKIFRTILVFICCLAIALSPAISEEQESSARVDASALDLAGMGALEK